MTDEHPFSKLRSLWPILLAGLFMLVGILILIYLGRDTARLMNGTVDEIDIHALLNTETAPTAKTLLGKVAVFHFWGTWSDDCRREFPDFVKIYEKYRDNPNVEFISVSCDAGIENDLVGLKRKTSEFLQSMNVNLPIYSDQAMFTRGRITRMLSSGGLGYPFTMVVDRQGVVRDYWLGSVHNSMEKLPKVIDRWVAEESRTVKN